MNCYKSEYPISENFIFKSDFSRASLEDAFLHGSFCQTRACVLKLPQECVTSTAFSDEFKFLRGNCEVTNKMTTLEPRNNKKRRT